VRCPRTGTLLTPVKVGGIEVDVSEECGGVFFDAQELQRFDDCEDVRGDLLIEHLKQFPPPLLDDSAAVMCPRCDTGQVMQRIRYAQQQLMIDECQGCGGIWLDAGELERLRQAFPRGHAPQAVHAGSQIGDPKKAAMDKIRVFLGF
jgi:Zn-finger nucleic acid-binding protein